MFAAGRICPAMATVVPAGQSRFAPTGRSGTVEIIGPRHDGTPGMSRAGGWGQSIVTSRPPAAADR
jgi:hypothetical protein